MAKGLCSMHRSRMDRHGELGTVQSTKAPYGSGTITVYGYHKRNINGKEVYTHRAVMEKRLGRPLRKDETVHHINGIKLDNRDENLELWTNVHPNGTRASDLVSYAKEILKRYEKT